MKFLGSKVVRLGDSFCSGGFRLLVFALLAFTASPQQVQAQADQIHYLPPLFARSDIGTHYLLVSTTETTPFDVTVRDGAGNTVATGADLQGVSRSGSRQHEFTGTQYSQLGLLDETELNLISTEGLIVTGPSPFLANIRERTAEQGGSLTSKGSFGLGTEFYSGHLISNTEQEQSKAHFISVMASEDDTDVVFDVSGAGMTPFGATGNPFSSTVTLDRGESYVIGFAFDDPSGNTSLNPNDVNGVRVTSDKPIAFTTGSWLAGNRAGNRKDIGIDQAVPVSRLGERFIVIKGKATTNAELLERPGVVAAFDGTDVFLNGSGTASATLDAGEYFYASASNYSAAGNMLIVTSKPAYLYQSTSGNDANSNGMSFIPPLRCNGTTDVVIPDVDLVGNSEIGIIARADATLSVSDENGPVSLPTGSAVPGTSDWLTYIVEVDGDVDISSNKVINVSLVTSAGDRGSAGFFSGFADAPGINVAGTSDLCDTSPITLTADATSGFASFQWYFNGDPIDGATGATYDASIPGDYTVSGFLVNDGSAECTGQESAQSPALTLNTDGCVCGDNEVDPLEQCDDGNTAADDGCGPTCLNEFCGDGIDNNAIEECDDGNTASNDGCGPTCLIEVCGDSIVHPGEQCDDGNTLGGDGCNANCLDEFCGDGVDNNGSAEECDDGNTLAGDGCNATCQQEFCGDGAVNDAGVEECDDGNTAGNDGCGPTCLFEFCGDGVTNNGDEGCDDGNDIAGDGCSPSCELEGCGDGIVQPSEECDDGNTLGGDGCNASCDDEFCGDGVDNDGSNEECDDGNTTPGDGCDGSCVVEFCGDGIDNNGAAEECDDGNAIDGDGCTDACTAEFCGDGSVNNSGVEECDDGNNDSDDGCGPTCLIEVCGDGIQQAGEECDDGNTDTDDGCGATCLNEGCGDGIQQADEECDDGNTIDDDGCDSVCVDEFCGDGLINDSDEECDDGNANPGDGCDDMCEVEDGFECTGEPSECTPVNPTLDQLFPGEWPDIDTSGRYVVFVSPADLHNDNRVGVDNSDGNNEVFFLDMAAKAKHGPGSCVGGSNSLMSCAKKSDCPGAIKPKPCGRFTQETDTTGNTSLFSHTAVANGGKATAYTDTTAGIDTVPVLLRKVFEKTSLLNALTNIGEGTKASLHHSGKLVAVESTGDITGDNPDGNSEIFVLDKKNVWIQITDTLAPVQNHRPKVTYNGRVMFDSNGDVATVDRKLLDNPDLNRELFLARFDGRKPLRIQQITGTTGVDLTLGCVARAGRHAYFSSTGDLHNNPKVTGIDNADGNEEVFHWLHGRAAGGVITQQTDSIGGENVNIDCAPASRLFVWESTSDLDGDGSSNRRVYVQNYRNGERVLMSPSSQGDSVRPRIGRKKVVFASTSNLTEKNAAMESVIYIFDTTDIEDTTAP